MASANNTEEIINMREALEDEVAIEEEAIAILGAGDEDNCTFSKGYMDRQALFSCVTCDPCHERLAGVCYGCSLHCHPGHEIIELYTKRNFRCDCGNSKFNDFKCALTEVKEEVNTKNQYNHNFKGKYCTCERPYPDPDDDVEDEMIQCILCEDWYHSRHLGNLSPDSYSEMICDRCAKENEFLRHYKHLQAISPTVIKKSDTTDVVDVTSCSSESSQTQEASTENNKGCLLKSTSISKEPQESPKAMFFVENWREKLCQCEECMKMYESSRISYITQTSDTIASYESIGKQNVEKVWEDAANQISQMNQVQKVELMHGYNDLKHGLSDFLKTFKENDVVRKEDIDGFFEELNKRKRRRMETGGGLPSDSCK